MPHREDGSAYGRSILTRTQKFMRIVCALLQQCEMFCRTQLDCAHKAFKYEKYLFAEIFSTERLCDGVCGAFDAIQQHPNVGGAQPSCPKGKHLFPGARTVFTVFCLSTTRVYGCVRASLFIYNALHVYWDENPQRDWCERHVTRVCVSNYVRVCVCVARQMFLMLESHDFSQGCVSV